MIDYTTNLECPNCYDIGGSVYVSSVGDYVCEVCGEWHEDSFVDFNNNKN